MRFIANSINSTYPREILPSPSVDIDRVLAAIAYGSNHNCDFLDHCINNGYRLDIWMRYDHTVPVAIPLLKRLLKLTNKNIFCYQVPDILHSKVIWWQGYGAYIGSANLSDRAWVNNIEAGIFITDIELNEHGLINELDSFFTRLRELEQTFPLSKETINELEIIEENRKQIFQIEEKAKKIRTVNEFKGLHFSSKSDSKAKRKEAFRTEWSETLTILRLISDDIVNYRPSWIQENTPAAWQADQFLHAYYYNIVRDGNKHPYEDFYQNNKKDPATQLKKSFGWWQSLQEPPTNEDNTLNNCAPYIRDKLSKENILNMNVEDFEKICEYTHATKDHILKIPLRKMDINSATTMKQAERIKVYSKWLLAQTNKKGWNVSQLLNYVLYEGKTDLIWERLFDVTMEEDYFLPHYGLNSIAEVIGWAQPETVPPRNGRTSKALRALGYDVRVYSS